MGLHSVGLCIINSVKRNYPPDEGAHIALRKLIFDFIHYLYNVYLLLNTCHTDETRNQQIICERKMYYCNEFPLLELLFLLKLQKNMYTDKILFLEITELVCRYQNHFIIL